MSHLPVWEYEFSAQAVETPPYGFWWLHRGSAFQMSLKSSGWASVVQKSEIPWAKVSKNDPLAPKLQIHPKALFGRRGVHSQLMEVGSAALKPEKPGVIHIPEEVARSLNRHQRLLLYAILHHDGKYKAKY